MDALSYLREVKEHFKFNKAVYDIFLDIMKEFKARRYVPCPPPLAVCIVPTSEQTEIHAHVCEIL